MGSNAYIVCTRRQKVFRGKYKLLIKYVLERKKQTFIHTLYAF